MNKSWAQLIAFQITWLLLVLLGQNVTVTAITALIFIAFNFIYRPGPSHLQLFQIFVISVFGLMGEALLWKLGGIQYPSQNNFPAYMIAIWLTFPLTLTTALSWIWKHRWLPLPAGVVGGLFSYYSAAQLGALTVKSPLLLALFWALFMLLCQFILSEAFTHLLNRTLVSSISLLLVALPCHASSTVGSGGYTYLFFPIYDSEVRTDNSQWVEIEITYKMNFTGSELVKSTADEWRRLNIRNEKVEPWLRQLESIFPDVHKGQTITARYTFSGGVEFLFRGNKIGQIDDDSFGRSFFRIWLSKESRDERLHRAFENFYWNESVKGIVNSMLE